ncbi:hypothetical protein D9M68_770550 [compost metagenome]
MIILQRGPKKTKHPLDPFFLVRERLASIGRPVCLLGKPSIRHLVQQPGVDFVRITQQDADLFPGLVLATCLLIQLCLNRLDEMLPHSR